MIIIKGKKRKTIGRTQKEFEDYFYSVFDKNVFEVVGEYHNNKTKIGILHHKCESVIYKRPDTIMHNKRITCGCESRNAKKNAKQFADKFYKHNSPLKFKLISDYDSSKNIEQNVKIKCLLCNKVFIRGAHQTYQGIRCNCQIKTYYVHNERYFKNIDSKLKAYFLGFIMADGSVEHGSSKTLRIKINNIDEDLLVKFLEEIDSNHIIENHHYRKDKIFSQIRINNNYIFDDLGKYGIVVNKTFSVKTPDIDKNLLKFFYLGLWDGDGGISFSDYKRSNGSIRREFKIYLTGTKENVYGFNKLLLDNNLVDKIYNTHSSSKSGNIVRIGISGNKRIKRIMDFLYEDAEFYLSRKYKKYIKLCNNLK